MLYQIAARSTKGDITITTRIFGTTIGAGPFFQGTAILHVMSNVIKVLEPGLLPELQCSFSFWLHFIDGTERQAIKDTDSNNNPRSRIRACSICDPFILILREDDTIGLFIGESERGKIRRKDMSPMGEKVCFMSCRELVILLSNRVPVTCPVVFSTTHPELSKHGKTWT